MKYVLYRLGDAQLPVIDFDGVDIEVPLFEIIANPMVSLTDEAWIEGKIPLAILQGQQELARQIHKTADALLQESPNARYLTIAVRTEPTVLAADDPGKPGKWEPQIGWVMFCVIGMVATKEPPTGTPEDTMFDTLPFWRRRATDEEIDAESRAHQAVALTNTIGFGQRPD
jgi:hypothetical protein